jgi:hypothetical protein
VFAQRNGERYEIQAVVPRAGEYDLRLFARRGKANERAYKSAIDWPVHASAGGSGVAGFPEVYADFVLDRAYLYGPRAGHLSSRHAEEFKVRVPGASAVRVFSHDHEVTTLGRQGDFFSGTATVPPGDVFVVPIFDGEKMHRSILKYTAD